MSTLKQMIERRDKAFQKATDKVFEAIPNVMSGIEKFVLEREGTGTATFKDVYIEGDILVLIGILEFSPGDVLEMPDGTSVVVTKFVEEYFKKSLRIGIAYELVTTGSAEEILSFLTISDMAASQASTTSPDFDLDDLTEEQQEQLRLFESSGGGKN